MKIDDSFLEKEAAKRRLLTWVLIMLFSNVITLTIIYVTGFFEREPTLARVIIYSEVVVFGIVYFVIRRKTALDSRK
ncbi:hypothetical protein [Pelagicoccus sp. SDUM812003]|uniref:hypothetical protein n=1 Tax=Pelagicoccus sp. SDUM812003 TaxID=3041267 RepID=UPI00280DE96D|nr:hypothetical protein [Pelagicoccus sp. SDUM812003]MDQ8203763.1 hypothetical protein [Pelagicoccus sp. SDUM812003]